MTSWWVLLVGAACLAAGWFYTGGPRPYGYAGLGEVFVFVFFGLVATVGTYYVETLHVGLPAAWFAAGCVGLLATALLLANNLRDIETDRVRQADVGRPDRPSGGGMDLRRLRRPSTARGGRVGCCRVIKGSGWGCRSRRAP